MILLSVGLLLVFLGIVTACNQGIVGYALLIMGVIALMIWARREPAKIKQAHKSLLARMFDEGKI